MAVKARAEITLSSIRDVQSVTRYYLLQSSTSAVPSKPTTNPPGGNWVTSEPSYTSGSTNSLYFVDLTVFSDGTFAYSDVSLSSSYEAAKVAYNKAVSAEGVANSASDKVDNLEVGGRNLVRRTDYSIYGNSNNYTNANRATFSSDRVTIPFSSEVYHKGYTKNTIKTPVPAGTKIIMSVYVYEQTVPDGHHQLYVAGLRSNGSVNWNHHLKAIPYGFVGKFTWEHTTPEDFYGFVLDFDTRSGTSGQMVLGPVKAEIGTLATDWTPAPEDVIEAGISAANEAVDGLQIGGRNLIINTLYPNVSLAVNRPKLLGQIGTTTGRGTVSAAEHGLRFTNTAVNWQYIYFGSSSNNAAVDMLGLEPGETYTLSADLSWKLYSAEGQIATTYYIGAFLAYSTVESGSFTMLNMPNQIPIAQADKGTEMSGRLVYTFTVPTTAKRLYLGIRGDITTTKYYAVGDYIEARNLKLEKGTKVTDWTPAPEDLENAITTSQETADGKNTVYYQNSAPTNQTFKVNDIWFDTDDENKMYHWNGSAWTAAPFGNAAFSNIDAGKVTTGTMSASRIKGDILTLGGANNVDGMLKVYDANGTLVGSFTREGLMAIAGTIGGWIINSSELTGEWQETYKHFESLLSPVSGLQFEETSTEPGFDAQFLNSIWYGTAGISFLRRRTVNNAVEQLSAFISADTNGGWDGSGSEGQITISPHLRVDGTGIDTPHMRADASYAWDLASGSYVRQPAMIMAGSTTISTGTSSKRATICTIPVEYQTGWRIIPFVTRSYGNAGATPADAGDFYYAYYNSADHKVCVKLANVLASGTAYTFDYMIYAVPTT